MSFEAEDPVKKKVNTIIMATIGAPLVWPIAIVYLVFKPKNEYERAFYYSATVVVETVVYLAIAVLWSWLLAVWFLIAILTSNILAWV